MYIINEYCSGGDFADLMDKYGIFPEFFVKYIMFQVFLAISFLHSNKVLNGDIKRENIGYMYIDNKKDKNEIDNFFKNFFNDKELQYELEEASGIENLTNKALSLVEELSSINIKFRFWKCKNEKKRKTK